MRSNDLDFDLPGPPAAFLAALAAAVEAWGGEWQADDDGGGGQLALPVVYGLKRGVLVGRIDVAAAPAGTHLHWRCEASHLEVHRAAVAILALAAVALLPALAWPFYPPLLALLPFAAVTGLIAWWAVISKLHTSGPRELFEELGKHLAYPPAARPTTEPAPAPAAPLEPE